MMPDPLFYQLLLCAFVGLCLMLHLVCPYDGATAGPTTPRPAKAPPKRSRDPQPFPGLTHKPHCEACAQAAVLRPQAPCAPPPRIVSPRGRPRQVDTSSHCCPQPPCAYRGWVGLGNSSANGHPNGGPWRQLHCTSCDGYFPEHHGTIFHGKQAAVELIVRVLACLAEGLGIRATARVFEVAPHTVLHWLAEAAEQLRAFSASFLCDLHVEPWQLDELYAV